MKGLIKTLLLVTTLRRLATRYIDPNTGGMLFQMLAVLFGLLTGALLFFSSRIRMAIARVRRFIRERRGKNVEEPMGEQSELTG